MLFDSGHSWWDRAEDRHHPYGLHTHRHPFSRVVLLHCWPGQYWTHVSVLSHLVHQSFHSVHRQFREIRSLRATVRFWKGKDGFRSQGGGDSLFCFRWVFAAEQGGYTISLFCVNRVRVHLYPNFPWVLPPGPKRLMAREIMIFLLSYRALVVWEPSVKIQKRTAERFRRFCISDVPQTEIVQASSLGPTYFLSFPYLKLVFHLWNLSNLAI